MDWETIRRQTPSLDGLRLMLASLGISGDVLSVTRLGGGLGASAHSITVDRRNRSPLRIVLKRYRLDDDTPAREWECLEFVENTAASSPTPLGIDLKGDWFGLKALVMTRLPGRTHMSPNRLERYLSQAAEAVERLQSVDVSHAKGVLLRPGWPYSWVPPQDWQGGATANKVIESIARLRPSLPASVLTHSDFHPVNLVWYRDRLSGIADWSSARVGHPWFDVAYFRTELTLVFGYEAAETFRKVCEELLGPAIDLPFLDLICGLGAIRWFHQWLGCYQEQGRRDLTMTHLRRRLRVFVQRALAQA